MVAAVLLRSRESQVAKVCELSRRLSEHFWFEPKICVPMATCDCLNGALLLLCDPRVWGVLSGEHGEALVARWGPMAADLLDPDNFPAELHANLVEALLARDNDTVGAIVEFWQGATVPGSATASGLKRTGRVVSS